MTQPPADLTGRRFCLCNPYTKEVRDAGKTVFHPRLGQSAAIADGGTLLTTVGLCLRRIEPGKVAAMRFLADASE